jgi:hypothetical protein
MRKVALQMYVTLDGVMEAPQNWHEDLVGAGVTAVHDRVHPLRSHRACTSRGRRSIHQSTVPVRPQRRCDDRGHSGTPRRSWPRDHR